MRGHALFRLCAAHDLRRQRTVAGMPAEVQFPSLTANIGPLYDIVVRAPVEAHGRRRLPRTLDSAFARFAERIQFGASRIMPFGGCGFVGFDFGFYGGPNFLGLGRQIRHVHATAAGLAAHLDLAA